MRSAPLPTGKLPQVSSIRGSGPAGWKTQTVLREIVDQRPRADRRRYGSIAAVDDTRQPQDFATAGLAHGLHTGMAAWPDGPQLFAHFRDCPSR